MAGGAPSLIILAAISLMGACSKERAAEKNAVVEVKPDVQALAEVDERQTLAFQQELANRFDASATTAAVEKTLKQDGYECDQMPGATTDRACLKSARVGACEVNHIVPSQPFVPAKAQVIAICEAVE